MQGEAGSVGMCISSLSDNRQPFPHQLVAKSYQFYLEMTLQSVFITITLLQTCWAFTAAFCACHHSSPLPWPLCLFSLLHAISLLTQPLWFHFSKKNPDGLTEHSKSSTTFYPSTTRYPTPQLTHPLGTSLWSCPSGLTREEEMAVIQARNIWAAAWRDCGFQRQTHSRLRIHAAESNNA